jgi:hypothetical protein
LTAGNYSTLSFLAVGVNGNQVNQTLTVTYTDGSTQQFTQSLSDWLNPQNYAGESLAATTAYTDLSNNRGTNNQTHYVYGDSFNVQANKQVASITLPNDANVVLLAMDVTPA